MKNKKKIILFISIWLLVEAVLIGGVFLKNILFEPNWQSHYECKKWNYACLEKTDEKYVDVDITCCLKKELAIWKEIRLFGFAGGLGISVLIAGLFVEAKS